MTDLRKAAEMALEALLEANNSALMELSIDDAYSDEITALRQALAQPDWTTDTPVPPFKYLDLPEYKTTQPEQEPVCDKDPYYCGYVRCQLGKVCKNTAPPKREWVGLTDEERRRYNDRLSGSGVAEEIEAKLKEKNT